MRTGWTLALLGVAMMAPARSARAGDEVAVRVEGSGVVLERRVFEYEGFEPQDPSLWSSTWISVCSAPCETTVPRGSYRIGGEGVRPSHLFALDAASGDRIVLRVKRASEAAHTGGLVLVGVGSVLLVGGGVVAFWGMMISALSGMFCFGIAPCSNGDGGVLAAGALGMTLGGTLVLAGAMTAVSNNASNVTQTVEAAPHVPASKGAFVVPLLGVRF